MPDHPIILLPGLHGTGDLFDPLIQAIPRRFSPRVLTYPPNRKLSYDQLLENIASQLAGEGPTILVAESFAGPLAVRYAADHPDRVPALVLSASFIRNPHSSWLRHMVFPGLFGLPNPARRLMIRWLMTGWQAPRSLVDQVEGLAPQLDFDVMAYRIHEVMMLDDSATLARCRTPILYLQAEYDRLVPPRSLAHLLAVREDIVVRKLPAPHLLLQTCPAAAWGEIEAFLRDHSARRSRIGSQAGGDPPSAE